jgi:hypothetical protein
MKSHTYMIIASIVGLTLIGMTNIASTASALDARQGNNGPAASITGKGVGASLDQTGDLGFASIFHNGHIVIHTPRADISLP